MAKYVFSYSREHANRYDSSLTAIVILIITGRVSHAHLFLEVEMSTDGAGRCTMADNNNAIDDKQHKSTMDDKKELDPVSAMSLAFGLFAFHLKQHVKVSECTVFRRKLLLIMFTTGCLSIVAMMLAAEERAKQQFNVLSSIVDHVYSEFYESQNKRKNNEQDNVNKKRKTKHDHVRAWQCIQDDYLGPEPIFTDKQFEEVFQLTKGKVEKLIQGCCRCQRASCATCGRDPCTLLHERLSTDSA